MSYGVQHSVPCKAFTSALRLVAASLKICYEICQTSTGQGLVHCRSSVTQASVKVVTRDELLGRILNAADSIWMSCNEQIAQFKTERRPAVAFSKTSFKHRSIQIKGNFTKLTLYLYFKLSCIMLVYYFVPFIVNNRYLLFWVSNGHNSVTVQNRTHVYVNFFDHKGLGNHLLQ